MRPLLILLFLLAGVVAAEPPLTGTTNGRDEVVITGSAGHRPAVARIPAGTIFQTRAGDSVTTLREAPLPITNPAPSEVRIPAAALSLKNQREPNQPATATTETDPRLASLLKLLATQPDLPRTTSQCAVFVLTEDLTFAQWLAFRAGAKPDEPLLEAIDALTILRVAEPQKSFRLAQDQNLKLRALRHPGTRGKAGQLYGLALPGDTAPARTPPDLGQLLHTKPGDNCPICRMRSQMQTAPSNGL
jgi:hypothetical protein